MPEALQVFIAPPSRDALRARLGGRGTDDAEQAKRVADRIEAGMVFVNAVGAEGVELPFGGVKNSGFGRELGKLGARVQIRAPDGVHFTDAGAKMILDWLTPQLKEVAAGVDPDPVDDTARPDSRGLWAK